MAGDVLSDCTLAAGPFPPEDRRCDWCGGPLSGRRRRWCSDSCSAAVWRNHAWTGAREAAKKRDGRRCVRCGVDPDETYGQGMAWRQFVEFVTARPSFPNLSQWAKEHGFTIDAQTRGQVRLAWLSARALALRPWIEAADSLHRWARTLQLEVNHKAPVLGRHAEFSCLHHVDGLETLCHRCHVQETNAQRAAGLLGGPARQPSQGVQGELL